MLTVFSGACIWCLLGKTKHFEKRLFSHIFFKVDKMAQINDLKKSVQIRLAVTFLEKLFIIKKMKYWNTHCKKNNSKHYFW